MIARLALAIAILLPALPAGARGTEAVVAKAEQKRKTTLPAPEDEDEPSPSKKKKTTLPAPEDEETKPPPRKSAPGVEDDEATSRRADPPRRRPRALDDDDERPTRRSDDDEEGGSRRGQLHSAREYTADEEPEENLSRLERRNYGLGGEATGGLALVQSSSGAAPDARFALGVRLAWEYGKLFSKNEEDWYREALIVELSWLFTSVAGVGTREVKVDAYYHYFTLAWILGIPVGVLLFYAELGPSLIYQPVSYSVDGNPTDFAASRLGLLYGVGARMRIETNDGKLAMLLRLEVVRFRRGYMNDTFLGLSLGMGF